ncbi:MAG: ethanolamine utilization protein EutH [Streptococcaceae bacterium]|jgi:ethanolamine transporter|nr:ethanolamine utilization protein EutH [Streptococcaceae bacterium]
MGINQIIMIIMVIFMILGAIDRIIGGKFGLGDKFEDGINAMGALTLSMVGIIVLAPVLKDILSPVVVPLYKALGADPSMFATTLLAMDMGGYPLAMNMAGTPEIGNFAGIILGGMMGPTIVFTIPVALGIIEPEDKKFLATGVLSGMVTIPLGVFVGGLVMGMDIMTILLNLIPIIIVAILIMLGLQFIPDKMTKGFDWFGKGVVAVAIIGLVLGAMDILIGFKPVKNIADIMEGFTVVGSIAVTLAGAFVLVFVITKLFSKPLMKVGHFLGMNDVAAAGMIATLANNIPMFQMMKDMDDRGKILNVSFAVSAAFVFGDHLGFTAGVNKEMIFPMIVSKLVAGITAIFVAQLMANRMLGKKNQEKVLTETTLEETAQ